MKSDHPKTKQLLSWVSEAQFAASEWRSESWDDMKMYDGGKGQWTEEDWQAAEDAGIDPITINRTFPAINLLLGTQVLNKFNIVAKARTTKDSEISQVMSEGIQFVLDQNLGEFLVSQGFKDSVIPGWGCVSPCLNSDPRREKLRLAYRDWKEMWWDPLGSPWLEVDRCRYVFHNPWMDLSELQGLFPEKSNELKEKFKELASTERNEWGSFTQDEATTVEEYKQLLAGTQWVNADRVRIRPVEMWYTMFRALWFAVFPDGRVIELKEDMPIMEQYQVVNSAQQVVSANVRKVFSHTFVGDLSLQRSPSPYPHDEFPYVPFIGYLDRYNFPYGVPRQIKGQDIEVNKRRSMALALLQKVRVIAEKDVVSGGEPALQALYEEANKFDGFLVVDPGKKDKIEIKEQGQLSQYQMGLLEQSEREIEETTGVTAERLGYGSVSQSGKAIEKKQIAGSTISAPLFENLRRSAKILGNQTVANIQGFWTGEKVLRVTDRVSGAEKFVVLNQIAQGEGGAIEVRNDITQVKFDVVVTDAPMTDTIREQNLNLIIEWVKKSPPEVIPHLMNLAFEMSNIPNKDVLLARIKPILGIDPREEDMSAEQVKQKVVEQLEAQQALQAQEQKFVENKQRLEIEHDSLENEKIKAEIAKLLSDAQVNRDRLTLQNSKDTRKANIDEDKLELEGLKTGVELVDKMMNSGNSEGARQ